MRTNKLLSTSVLGTLVVMNPMLSTFADTAHAQNTPFSVVHSELSADQIIEAMFGRILRSKKSLPEWAFNSAMNIYKVWKTYSNGKKIEEAQAAVLAVLKVVDEIRAEIEQGRALSAAEYRWARELLDLHGKQIAELDRRLHGLDQRVGKVEEAVYIAERKRKAWLAANRVCPPSLPGHVMRDGRCVHISVAGPRR